MDYLNVAISNAARGIEPVSVDMLLHPHARQPQVFLLREALDNRGPRLDEELARVLVHDFYQQRPPLRAENAGQSLYLYNWRSGVWDEYGLTIRNDLGLRCSLRGAVGQFELENKLGQKFWRSFDESVRQAINDLVYLEYRQTQAPLKAEQERFLQVFSTLLDQWRQIQEPETQQQVLTALEEQRAYWQAQRAERRR